MKIITTLFAIGLMAGCNAALAAETIEAVGGGVATSKALGADPSKPFTSAYVVEEQIYLGAYYGRYHGLADEYALPLKQLPSTFDLQGRPLWFDGDHGDVLMQDLVSRLLDREQFDDLDHLFDDWNSPSERMADGRWKLITFQVAIHEMFDNTHAWEAIHQLISRWREKSPKSRAAVITEALYWINYAWDARGGGSANSVTSEGWKLFHERLQKAEAVLFESKPYASSSPLWARVYIDVGRGLGWKKEKLNEIFLEATKQEKYFYPIYTGMVDSLVPKWGGSWLLIDSFIKNAVKNTQEVDGYSMYARLYWSVSKHEDLEFNLFRDSLATWPEMKHGFEDIIGRYPHSAWDINNFAAFASIAGDKETFQSLRARIGNTITPGAWRSNYSLDLCEHKFAAQP